jgi:hypothetical protein
MIRKIRVRLVSDGNVHADRSLMRFAIGKRFSFGLAAQHQLHLFMSAARDFVHQHLGPGSERDERHVHGFKVQPSRRR